MDAQAAAWNRGDLEGYMDGYERAETTTFVSGDTVTRGWRTVLERYKARYDTRSKMGTLAFSELEFKPLSEFYIMATGRWQLTREADTPHGRFTLIFRRTAAGWRIVHDHTSSAS
jgi:ketosteroid isomerase-like protein